MIGAAALAARALGDAGWRDLATSWGGPAPAILNPTMRQQAARDPRRFVVRKP